MTTPSNAHDLLIRLGVTLNAVASLISGGLLLIGASAVGDALDVDIDRWLSLFGAALIAHALFLGLVRRTDNPNPWTWANLAMIAPYPAIMVALAATIIDPIGGKILVLIDGAIVAAVAFVQFLGLRRNNKPVALHQATS